MISRRKSGLAGESPRTYREARLKSVMIRYSWRSKRVFSQSSWAGVMRSPRRIR